MKDGQKTLSFDGNRKISFFRGINRLFTRVYHHVEVRSPPQIPPSGGAILVSNHISGLDPLVIQSALNRPVVWMMAKEYYEIASLRWLFELIQAIPVQRSGRDMVAMRSAMRTLENGNILGVFPEGRIAATRELLPFQTGVALMAAKTATPIYCCALDGNSRGLEMRQAFSRRCEIKLAFGGRSEFDRCSTSREHLEAATASIKADVDALRRGRLDKINRL